MWKFINTGPSRGAFNMLYDEQLARELAVSEFQGFVRVYGWSPPCISLGYHQRLTDLNLVKCQELGVDVVRRPTGGRAVLHWDEVTYSVVSKVNGESLSEVYCSIGLALVNGLRRLNPEIALARLEAQRKPFDPPTSNIPCYASIARYEIQYRGKKIVGSAQRRYRFPSDTPRGNEIVLQHGSVLLGAAHRRITEFLATKNEETKRILAQRLEEKSAELSNILGRIVGFEEVADSLKRGFEAEWAIRFQDVDPKESFAIQGLPVTLT